MMQTREDDVAPTAAHRETVRTFSRAGGPLDPTGPNATTANPQWFFDSDVRRRTPERRSLHRRLLDETRAEHPAARRERRAVVLAGPPGAGKSVVLRDVLGVDASGWIAIDADEFKKKLLREALADGSYDAFLKPEAIKNREAAGEPFYPLELASLVHEESSYLAKQMQREMLAEGVNVVIDSVLSKPDRAVELGQRLEAAGYTIEVVDVEVPFELSAQRIVQRWRESYENAVATGEGLGGRWVPSVYVREVFNPETGRACSQESAQRLAQQCDAVIRYRRFWTSHAEAVRIVEADLARAVQGGPLVVNRDPL
ncbi:zeta toxin family protein [Georgenia sp. TF02-10]|uniref:zeta toxin family protein n=1 Tax=Georgenia sp. TF02-10 TaxID=2917725 RepID=UPI001FA7F79D|nr:zeta toxin family protein [Georgenia sp. TF02-10]UNX53175.1 zeta toxin family protein [Georgenia sp. TF02-10]